MKIYNERAGFKSDEDLSFINNGTPQNLIYICSARHLNDSFKKLGETWLTKKVLKK